MENNKSRHGRRYDWEFKQSAIALVQEGRTITEVGRDLGVSTCSVSRWVQATQRASTPPQGSARADELRHLRQENEYLRRQRDILKKALGILSAGMPGDVSR